jgi:tetratricopeptide (TPR) repeat protein
MTLDPFLEEIRRRLDELHAAMEEPPERLRDRRAWLRDGILELNRDVDRAMAELERTRASLRPVAERYREAFSRPAVGGASYVDHLGSSTYRERGWSALAGADYERAVRELERAVELDPFNPSNHTLLAWSHLRLQLTESARSALEEALRLDPGHALARTCWGYLLLREGQHAEAIEPLSQVVREGTDPTATLYGTLYLGVVYAERDMHRDAQAFFRRALEMGPNLIEAYWELGRSYQREGRNDLALEAWRAGSSNRFNPWGERCGIAAAHLEGGPG